MKKRHYDFLSLVLTGTIYLYSIIRATLVPTRAPVSSWQMLLFAAGTLLFYCVISTKPGLIVFLFASGSGLCYAAYLLFRDGLSDLSVTFAPVVNLINVMIRVGTGLYDETIPFLSLMTAVGVYSLLVGLPVYFFVVRYFRFYAAFVPGLVFFMVIWGLNRFVDKLSFFIFIIVAIICYIRHTYVVNFNKTGSGNETGRYESMLWFAPVALVTVILAATIPVNPKPIEWPWLDRKIYDFWWDMKRKYTIDRYDTFSLAETGFGNPSRLGGPVYPNDTPILRVKAPTRVYLRGAVYDIYNGNGWERTEKSTDVFSTDRVYDHRQLLYGWKAMAMGLGITGDEEYNKYLLNRELPGRRKYLSAEEYSEFLIKRTMPAVLSRLFPEEKLSVQHLQVRTGTLFTPLKLFVPITGISPEVYRLNESAEGIFQAERRLRGGSTYHISYLQPAYGMREIENYFNLSKPGLYREFNEYLRYFAGSYPKAEDLRSQQLANVLEIYEELQSYSEEVYRIYTVLPEGIPERVISLAREITRGYATTYSKVKELESYLRENYRYTLNPSYPPSEHDFVDYFLFEGKEGYCSYFASALCVMARAVGIPARYVEGFLPPQKSPAEEYYYVTNQNAHAWVEVFLEGVGWVTFEPTPPMANAQNYYVRLEDIETGNEGLIPDMYEEEEPDRTTPKVVTPRDIDDLSPETETFSRQLIFIGILALIMLVIVMNLIHQSARWIIVRLMPPKRRVVLLYRRIVSYLSQAGSVKKRGQTPKDYAQEIDELYKFTSMSMSEMTDIYYSVRFGSHDIGKDTMKRIFSFLAEIKKETGRNMYTAKKIIYRYLLFKG